MVNASCVNTKVIAMQAHDNGKLKAAPSIVSVTDSSNAFLSIFIKKLFQVFIYMYTPAWGGNGGVTLNISVGVPVACCDKEREKHNIITPRYRS